MRYLINTALLLITWAVIAFAMYVTNDPATFHPLTDTLEVMAHSEISEYEVCGEIMIEQQIERSERCKY